MEDQNTKPLFSERLTFQVTPEVKARLLKLADEQYGGDRQALGRAALEGCLQREYTRRGYTARILETLDELRGEVATKATKKDLEDIALGADLEEILDTVKMIRKDILKWNDIIARIFEQLGVKPKP